MPTLRVGFKSLFVDCLFVCLVNTNYFLFFNIYKDNAIKFNYSKNDIHLFMYLKIDSYSGNSLVFFEREREKKRKVNVFFRDKFSSHSFIVHFFFAD